MRPRRAGAAPRHHPRHRRLFTFEHRFHRAVAAVPHPTRDTGGVGLAPARGPKSDALHLTGNDHPLAHHGHRCTIRAAVRDAGRPMIADLLTVAVLGLVGVRLVSSARIAVTSDARRYTVEIVRGIRWRHVVQAPLVLTAVSVTAVLLYAVP